MSQVNTLDTVTKSRLRLQIMAMPLIALQDTDQAVLRDQLYGSTAPMTGIDVIKTYAQCCALNNDSYLFNSDDLRNAMDGVDKFLMENGALNLETSQWQRRFPDDMKEAGISEPHWNALVAIKRLYRQNFKNDKKVDIDTKKIHQILDGKRDLRLLLKISMNSNQNLIFYKKLYLINGDAKITNGVLNLINFMNREPSDTSSIMKLAEIWREFYSSPENHPEFESNYKMKNSFQMLNEFYSEIAGF